MREPASRLPGGADSGAGSAYDDAPRQAE